MVPLGQNIMLWRVERGMTQDELSAKSRISRPNLSAIEQGRRDLTIQTLRSLAVALDVRPGLLVDGVSPGSEKPLPALSREALERIAVSVARGKELKDEQEKRTAYYLSPL